MGTLSMEPEERSVQGTRDVHRGFQPSSTVPTSNLQPWHGCAGMRYARFKLGPWYTIGEGRL
jgi:hypothetical protein